MQSKQFLLDSPWMSACSSISTHVAQGQLASQTVSPISTCIIIRHEKKRDCQSPLLSFGLLAKQTDTSFIRRLMIVGTYKCLHSQLKSKHNFELVTSLVSKEKSIIVIANRLPWFRMIIMTKAKCWLHSHYMCWGIGLCWRSIPSAQSTSVSSI